jgi:hypothetical protein
MSTVAAKGIGSSALRLAIAEIGPDGLPGEAEITREPVRLGLKDVYQTKVVIHDPETSGAQEAGQPARR